MNNICVKLITERNHVKLKRFKFKVDLDYDNDIFSNSIMTYYLSSGNNNESGYCISGKSEDEKLLKNKLLKNYKENLIIELDECRKNISHIEKTILKLNKLI